MEQSAVSNNYTSYIPQVDFSDKILLDELISSVEIGSFQKISLYGATLKSRFANMDMPLVRLETEYIISHFRKTVLLFEACPERERAERYISSMSESAILTSVRLPEMCRELSVLLTPLQGGSSNKLLGGVKRFIDGHFSENLTLKQLGAKFDINSTYLGQIFCKEFGICFKDYLNRVRMAEAASRISGSNEKISDIAFAIGYKSLDYFTKKFTSLNGLTPKAFRKRSRIQCFPSD